MATVVPVALLAGAAVAAPASAMTARSATFDAGGFGEWDLQPNVAGPGSPSVTTTTSNPCAGAQSARASVGAGSGNKFARTIWGGTVGDPQALNWGDGSEVWYGTALYLPNGFGAAMQSYYVPMRWDTYGVSNVTRSGVSMYASGQWQLFAEQDGVHPQANLLPSTFKLSEGVWHTLEVHQRLSGSAGSALNELYVDGVRMGSSTAPNYFGTPVSAIRYGIVAIDQDRQTNALSVQYDSPYAGPTRRSIGCGTTAPAPAPSTPAAPAPAPSTPATTAAPRKTAPVATLDLPDRQVVKVGTTLRLHGVVRPRAVGTRLRLQVLGANGAWRTVRYGTVLNGRYDTYFLHSWRPHTTGRWTWRAVSDGAGRTLVSKTKVVIVR